MKRSVKYLLVGLLLMSGCERQLPVVDNLPIAGYEIQGKVTDRIGNPMPNVSVFLDYSAEPSYIDTVITRQYFVPDSVGPIQAVAANLDNQIVYAITTPRKVVGWFQATWNGIDSTGNLVPSGLYHIQYIIGGRVVFSYDQLVSGGLVAVTDIYGRYTIPSRFLPIDSASIPYFSIYDSSYVYNLHVTNDVLLTFVYSPRVKRIPYTLYPGSVTFVDAQFN